MNLILLAISWSIINRLRGWGNGWNKTEKPDWLVWAQKYVFTRHWLALLQGAITGWYAYSLGFDHRAILGVSGAVAIGWWFGVLFGWGEYFDGTDKPNDEIHWIDQLVGSRIIPWMQDAKRPGWIKKVASKIWWKDALSFGLRGTYYLPMYLGVAYFAQSSWAMLPALFFWIDAVTYATARNAGAGDFVRWAELAGGFLRGLMIGLALLIAV